MRFYSFLLSYTVWREAIIDAGLEFSEGYDSLVDLFLSVSAYCHLKCGPLFKQKVVKTDSRHSGVFAFLLTAYWLLLSAREAGKWYLSWMHSKGYFY